MLEIKVGHKVVVELGGRYGEKYNGYLLIGKVLHIDRVNDMLVIKFHRGFVGHNCGASFPELGLTDSRNLLVDPLFVKGIVK